MAKTRRIKARRTTIAQSRDDKLKDFIPTLSDFHWSLAFKTSDLNAFLVSSRSKLEQRWNKVHDDVVAQHFGKRVMFRGYEWFEFKLPGGKYKPDWAYLFEDGTWAIVEIKASSRQSNYRDARSKLRAAASLNPWFAFYEVKPLRGKAGWSFELIRPDLTFLSFITESIDESNTV